MDIQNILAILLSFSICALAKDLSVENSVFETDLCNVTCPEQRNHTMCEKTKIEPCRDFHAMIIKKGYKADNFMRLIVQGHNGLRNRVAEVMNVPNMLELTWDTRLSKMALNFLQGCPKVHEDTCTTFSDTVQENDTLEQFYKQEFSHAQIVQNTYSQMGTFYPYKFIERALRAWYFEKEGMAQPILAPLGSMDYSRVKVDRRRRPTIGPKYGRLNGENNFTHLINPLSFRLGCAMATYHGNFNLVCNYFPYFRTASNTLRFRNGHPVSKCPTTFPMRDNKFNRLCTADTESFFDEENAANRRLHDVNNVFFVILFFYEFFVFKK